MRVTICLRTSCIREPVWSRRGWWTMEKEGWLEEEGGLGGWQTQMKGYNRLGGKGEEGNRRFFCVAKHRVLKGTYGFSRSPEHIFGIDVVKWSWIEVDYGEACEGELRRNSIGYTWRHCGFALWVSVFTYFLEVRIGNKNVLQFIGTKLILLA